MKDRHISYGQFGGMLWAGVLAPVAELLPVVTLPIAGRGAWLAPLVALILLLPVIWRVGTPAGSLLTVTKEFGAFLGKGILIVYLIWIELLLTLRLGLCTRRLLVSGERDGSVWFFLLILTGLALWMGGGKLTAFARAGQLFLVLLVGVAGLVFLLSLPKIRPDWILPLWVEDITPAFRAGFPVVGCILWAVLPLLCLPIEQRETRKPLVLWIVGGCGVLTMTQLIILGNLGVGLAQRSGSPFFALTKSVGIEGAFQRVESVIAALWMLADLTLIVSFVFALREIVTVVGPTWPVKRITSGLLLLASGFALLLCRQGQALEHWNQSWVLVGNLVLYVGAIALLYVGKWISEKKIKK